MKYCCIVKAALAGGWPDNSPLPGQLDAQCQRQGHHSPSYGDLGGGEAAIS